VEGAGELELAGTGNWDRPGWRWGRSNWSWRWVTGSLGRPSRRRVTGNRSWASRRQVTGRRGRPQHRRVPGDMGRPSRRLTRIRDRQHRRVTGNRGRPSCQLVTGNMGRPQRRRVSEGLQELPVSLRLVPPHRLDPAQHLPQPAELLVWLFSRGQR